MNVRSRKVRVTFPRAIYHVMSRGDQRDDISYNTANARLHQAM
jgi:hypothetical protein